MKSRPISDGAALFYIQAIQLLTVLDESIPPSTLCDRERNNDKVETELKYAENKY